MCVFVCVCACVSLCVCACVCVCVLRGSSVTGSEKINALTVWLKGALRDTLVTIYTR